MQLKSGAIGNKSNKTISCFFEETDKVDKPLDTSKERKKIDTHYQFQKWKGGSYPMDMTRIIKAYCKQLHVNICSNLDEKGQVFEGPKHSVLTRRNSWSELTPMYWRNSVNN